MCYFVHQRHHGPVLIYNRQSQTPRISRKNLPKVYDLCLNWVVYFSRLTVTDSDGATNSTFASVTVIKEVDYPPKANAGSNVIIGLPQNSVTLYGNSSTDDKGIASYEWIKHEDHLTADMLVKYCCCLPLEILEPSQA